MGQQKLEKALVNRMSPDEQEIRDYLNVSNINPNSGVPPTAPMFRKDPEVWSVDPNVLKPIQHLMKIAPEIRGSVNKVEQGPSQNLMEVVLGDLKNNPENTRLYDVWDRLNVLGVFNPQNKNIWLNPNTSVAKQAGVIGHEIAHAKNYNHDEPGLERTQKLMTKMYRTSEDQPDYLDSVETSIKKLENIFKGIGIRKK